MREKRKLCLITVWLLVITSLLLTTAAFATEYSSTSYKVLDPVINDSSGAEMSSTSYRLRGVVGELVTGRTTSTSFAVNAGSLTFPNATVPVLTATAGALQVPLSWTASVGSLGWTISSYEVCQGTSADTYTSCTDVGNVTTATRTGLTASTAYFFRIRGKDAFGSVVVRSDEATATPTAAASTGGSGGGGGVSTSTSPTTADVTMSGRAYPGAIVSLLTDGVVSQTITAGADGSFSGSINTVLIGRVYTFGASARDAVGRSSPLFTQTVNLASALQIVNIFLAPTISVSSSTVVQGQTLTVYGSAFPASFVRVSIPSAPEATTTATQMGGWSVSIPTGTLTPGTYSARAAAEISGSSSDQSSLQNFTISSVPVPPGPICRGADVNNSGAGDGRVNAKDVSILLTFWEKPTFTENPCVDIFRDGVINLRDLSVLLFNWTG
ncbi:MAG: hypothetical protein Q7S48_04705 [bacterium]|nr:hypothetical protein [bacterium]